MDTGTRNIDTSDITLAATLKFAGYQLSNITIDGKRGTFHFEEVDNYLIDSFNLGNARVEPQAFNACIKALTTSVKRIR